MRKAHGVLVVAAVLVAGCTGEGGEANGDRVPTTVAAERQADGVVECPRGPFNPATGEQIVYTPPCTRQRIGNSGAYYLYDGNGVLFGSVTP